MSALTWPRSLHGQMIALVLIGLGIAQLLGFALSRLQQRHAMEALREEDTLARIASVVHLLADTPEALHERISRAVSSRPLQLTVAPEPVLDTSTASRHRTLLHRQLATLLDTDSADIRISVHSKESHDKHGHLYWPGARDQRLQGQWTPAPQPAPGLAVAVRLSDGHWLNAVSTARPPDHLGLWPTLRSSLWTALVLSGLMILMVRRITRPLARLALAAGRFGRGETVPPLAEQGPLDVQETIRAFNHMRARLERFVQDRTHVLAAISHDLRTPITALRVRAELIDEPDTRGKILATLDEMQCITEATLGFVREEAAQEDTRLLDLDALIQSVCDDLSDMGKDVTFTGPGKTLYRCRSVSLRRALSNLVENAVTYGQRAWVTLTEEQDVLCINIDDDGPGIAAPDMERVFEPFVRLEASCSRETGGVGLGMTIARSIVRGHGGDITLTNRPEGGLRVAVRVPIVLAQ
jgi:signal transduction histidine kinase